MAPPDDLTAELACAWTGADAAWRLPVGSAGAGRCPGLRLAHIRPTRWIQPCR